MKKFLSFLLIFTLLLSLFSCKENEPEGAVREIACTDIAAAYQNAGYTVYHGEHNKEGADTVCDVICEGEDDTVYFTTYFTEEDAKAAHEKGQYNIVIWFYATLMGESRWLKCDKYGKITYTYFEKDSLAPFERLKALEDM